MRKISLLLTLVVAGITFVADASYAYTTRCGRVVSTVSPDFFSSQKEWDEYYAELDEIWCGAQVGGEEGPGHIIGNIGGVAP